jgi:hypothetical protein
MQVWKVTLEKNGKRWDSYTSAKCKCDAIRQLESKYNCGAKVIKAEVSKNKKVEY